MRIMNKLSLLGVAALLAACGGGDNGGNAGQTTDNGGAAAPAAEAPATPPPAAPAASGDVVEVRMLTSADGASGTFEPANVTVKKGQTIRFVTDGKAAHNVSFPPAENAGKSNLPAPSPYVTTAGTSVDVVANMDAGTYNFQCDPHATMGMKGVLTVQ
ncbi:MAG TPA: plastocyanin/azurin family copper-binding protein [Longimicrobium sp.]|jgi:plastocyanin